MSILPGSNTLSYVGKEPVKRDFIRDRAPLPTDNKPFDIGDSWIDETGQKVYRKVAIDVSGAVWVATGTVNPASIETVITDSGTATPNLANQINMNGANGITTSATGNAVIINYTSGIQPTDNYVTNSGVVVPVSGSINVFGGSGITTSAASGNTIQIDLSGGSTFASLYTCNSGSAAPAAGNLNVFGGAGTTTTGAGSTITIGLSGGGAGIDSMEVDSVTAPGVNPVTPDGTGLVTIKGGTGVITTSVALNEITINAAGTSPAIVVSNTPGSTYLTIQEGIDAAVALGATCDNMITVYVAWGSATGTIYTEDVILKTGVNLIAEGINGTPGSVTIIGAVGNTLTLPDAGCCAVQGFKLQAIAGQNPLASVATTAVLSVRFENCLFDGVTNAPSSAMDVSDVSGGFAVTADFFNCQMNGTSLYDGVTSPTILSCKMVSAGDPVMKIGASTTVTHLFSSVDCTGVTDCVEQGGTAGTYQKAGVALLGTAVGIGATLTVISIPQV